MGLRKFVPSGVVRLIINGKVEREKRYKSYSESKALISDYVELCGKFVENTNSVIYIEVTRY